MSVTFNRAELIKVAEAALKEHVGAQEAYQNRRAQFRKRHEADAVERTRENARDLRDTLSKALRRGGVVTYKEVRTAMGDDYIRNVFYMPPDDYVVTREMETEGLPKGRLNPAEVTETQALLKVLKAAEGDTVSANELKLLGLKNLGPIFIAAAKAKG
jgi:hypothetical protein